MQASMHALQESAHILQTALASAWVMHSSMHTWHMAMQASSIAIIDVRSMPAMRIIDRIIVLHMSAQFMHMGAHDIIWPSIVCTEQTVHACSQAEQASIQACMRSMSMPAIVSIDIMSLDIWSIIIASIPRHPSVDRRGQVPPATRHATSMDAGTTAPG
jgi:hypothetical protein